MNLDDLPLSFAPITLLIGNVDGTYTRCPFTHRESAEKTASFLRTIAPEGDFHVTEPTPVFPAFAGTL